MSDLVQVAGVSAGMRWQVAPEAWRVAADGSLHITAGPRTDMFISPAGDAPTLNAPRLLAPVSGDFQLSARVTVAFESTFDAGALLVWRDERRWAKLCFEYSPQRQPMVVSVVTRGESDDANSSVIDGAHVWLRVSRMGQALAFHSSADGRTWDLVRHFGLDAGDAPLVGFVGQSPTGAGCAAAFSEVRLSAARLADIRSGA